jgi:ketosteroid isomerase-like protein
LIAAAVFTTTLVALSVFWMFRPTRTAPEGAVVHTRPSAESIEQKPVVTIPAPTAPPPTNAAAAPPAETREHVSPPAPRAEPQRSTPQIAEGPTQPVQPPLSSIDLARVEPEGERPAAAVPENAPVAPKPPPAPASILESPQVRAGLDHDAVSDTLRRYQAAYRALDVNRILEVYPSLARDQAAQLRRTFDSVTQYEVDIRNPQIDVHGDTAVVRAAVARRMTPRVGNPVTNEVQTEFRLRREGSTWLIAGVAAR